MPCKLVRILGIHSKTIQSIRDCLISVNRHQVRCCLIFTPFFSCCTLRHILMSHPKSYLSTEAIGYIGLSIYGSIFVVSVIRLYAHFVPYKPPWYSTRKLFHILVTIYAILQTYSYVAYARGKEHFTKACYACHLLGIFAEVCAFSLIAILWSKYLLSVNNARRVIIPCLVIIDIAFLGYIAYLISDMLLSKDSFADWVNTEIYKTLLLIEPILLIINGSCMVYLGISINKKLINHPSWGGLSLTEKNTIVYRLWLTMTFCVIGFSLRATMELYLYFNEADGVSTDIWWITSTWIPTIMPACVLLYTMRKTDSTNVHRYLTNFNRRNKPELLYNGTQSNISQSTSTSSWFKDLFLRRNTEHGASLTGFGEEDEEENLYLEQSLNSEDGDTHSALLNYNDEYDVINFHSNTADHGNLTRGVTGVTGGNDGSGHPSKSKQKQSNSSIYPRDSTTSTIKNHMHSNNNMNGNGNKPSDSVSSSNNSSELNNSPLDFYQGAPNNNGLYRYKSYT